MHVSLPNDVTSRPKALDISVTYRPRKIPTRKGREGKLL
jgi:hypothetical protein